MRHTESGASGHARDCRLAGHGRDRAIKPARINDVWHSGWEPRVIMLSIFIATLVLPMQEAVFLGVALSMLHYLYASSVGVRTVSMTPLVTVIEQYAHTLRRGGATLVLAEVSPPLYAQLVKTGSVEICGAERVFLAEADVFAATRRALQAATPVPPV